VSEGLGYELWERFRVPLLGLAILVAIGVGLLTWQQARLAALQEEGQDTLAETRRAVETLGEPAAPGLRGDLEGKLQAVEGLQTQGTDLGALMLGIEAALPPGCSVAAFGLRDGELDFSVRCPAGVDTSSLAPTLAAEGLADVTPVPSEMPDTTRLRGPVR